MLQSTRMLHRKRKTKMPHPERCKAVRKSMAMIKVVLGERQRAKREADLRLAEERTRERALSQLDLAASEPWPPWIPGHPREMQVATAPPSASCSARARREARSVPPAERVLGGPRPMGLAPSASLSRAPPPRRPISPRRDGHVSAG